MADKNKRAYERIPFTNPVRIRTPAAVDGTGIDLGAGGVAVRVPTPLAQGSTVQVDLLGAGAPVSGTVRGSAPHPAGGFRLGIKWHVENGQLVSRMRELAT